MDPKDIQEAAQAANSLDWHLVARWLATIGGWIAAVAGWTAFFVQRHRHFIQDIQKWDEAFVAYRRNHLKPFSESLRVAYDKLIKGNCSVLQTWEEATHASRWPRNIPLPDSIPLQLWRDRYGVGLDTEDEYLFKFAEAIYPAFNDTDKRPLRERSILAPEQFDAFDNARGGVADYFDTCGMLATHSEQFAKFWHDRIRPNHYYKLKIAAYLELALARAWGPRSETGPGKVNLFALGNICQPDDRRY